METHGRSKPSEEDFHYIGNSDFKGLLLFSKVDGTCIKSLHVRNHKSHPIRIGGSPVVSTRAFSTDTCTAERFYTLSLTSSNVKYSYYESGTGGGSGGFEDPINCALCGVLYDLAAGGCPNGCDSGREEFCIICRTHYDASIYNSCPNGCSPFACYVCGKDPCICDQYCERCGSPYCPGPWYCSDNEDGCKGEKCNVCGGYKQNARSTTNCPVCTCDTPPEVEEEQGKKEVTLKIKDSKITLLSPYGLSIFVPSSMNPTDVEFQIAESSGGQYWTLQKGSSLTCDLLALKAGHWIIKAIVTMSDHTVVTPATKDIEIQFPDASTIQKNATVVAKMEDVWILTKNALTQASRQEKGFWIYLNTGTRGYEFGDIQDGPLVKNELNTHGELVVDPHEKTQEPSSPLESGISHVAFFHTHTALTYCPRDAYRPVGFSPKDDAWANSDDNAPLFLYDYVGRYDLDKNCLLVLGGHNVNDRAQISWTGIKRRKTP